MRTRRARESWRGELAILHVDFLDIVLRAKRMGYLASFLQGAFAEKCPNGWTCRREEHVLSDNFEKLLGYSPRADVCLENEDASRRLWIEFEISRADPVANHTKFATAHLFKHFDTSDTFVSMVSSHVARGPRNLASNTIHLLRHVGISAFQTVLLPTVEPDQIKRLNHSSLETLRSSKLDIPRELNRVFQIVEPMIEDDGHRIHFASELFDVIRNLHRWNSEVAQPDGAELWKRRTVTYFVFDPVSKLFAPSKYCGYAIPVRSSAIGTASASGLMNMQTYCALDESDRRFDGNRARAHLTTNLGMNLKTVEQAPEIGLAFNAWILKQASTIVVHPTGAKFLLPPTWYR